MAKKPKKDKPELPKKSGPGADKINDKFIKTVLSDLKKIRLGLNGKSPKGNQNLTDVTIKNDHQAFLVTKSVRDRLDLLVDLAQQQLQAQRETPSSRPNTSPDAGDFDSWFGHLQGKLEEICGDINSIAMLSDSIESNTVGAGHHLGQIVLGVNFLNDKIAQHLVSMRELIDATKANAPATSSGSISIAPIVGKLDEIKTSIEPTVGKLDEIKQVLLAIQTSIQASMPEGAPASVEGRHEQSQEQKDVVLKQTKILEQIRDGVKDNSKSIESSKQSGSSEGGMGILGSLIRGAAITSALAIGVDLLGQAIWGKTAWEEERKTFFDGLKTAIDATKDFVINTLPVALEAAFKWIRDEGPGIWNDMKSAAIQTWEVMKEVGRNLADITEGLVAFLSSRGEKETKLINDNIRLMAKSGGEEIAANYPEQRREKIQKDFITASEGPFRKLSANSERTEYINAIEKHNKNNPTNQLFMGSDGKLDKELLNDAITKSKSAPERHDPGEMTTTEKYFGLATDSEIFAATQSTKKRELNDFRSKYFNKNYQIHDPVTGELRPATNEELERHAVVAAEKGHAVHGLGHSKLSRVGNPFQNEDIYNRVNNITLPKDPNNPASSPRRRDLNDAAAEEARNEYNRNNLNNTSGKEGSSFGSQQPQVPQVPQASPTKGEKVSEALNISASNHFDSTVAQPTAVASNITNNNIMVNSGSSSTTGSQGADSSTVLYSLNNPETLAQQVAWDINRMSLA